MLIALVVVLATAAAVLVVVYYDFTGSGGSGLGKPFVPKSYVRRIDPHLRQYAEAPRLIDTTLQQPRGVAVAPDGRVYVVGDEALCIFSPQGERLDRVELSGAPRCLAVAKDGRVYVGFADHVEVLTPDGRRLSAWKTLGEKAFLVSLAVTDTDVFAADRGRLIVVRYDLSGKQLGTIGGKDTERGIAGLLAPSPYMDVAVAPDGLIWVASPGRRRLEAYSPDGQIEHLWGKQSTTDIEGFAGCCNPAHMTILPDGRFVTSEKGSQPVVKVYGATGVLEAVVAAEKLSAVERAGFDVTVDNDGRILILDHVAKTVRTFTRKASEDSE